MNSENYIAEAERQLSNEKYYEKLLENPNENFKKNTISEIQDKWPLQCFENFNLSSENRHLNSIFCLRNLKPKIQI